MNSNYLTARLGKLLELDCVNIHENGLPKICLGLGRGARITGPIGFASIWLIQRGQVNAIVNGTPLLLQEGQLIITLEGKISITSCGDAAWLGVAMPLDTFCNLLSESSGSQLALQTGIEFVDLTTMPWAKTLVLSALQGTQIVEIDYLSFINFLFQLEKNARDQISRCPGRTDKARKLAFNRLAKAKAHITSNPKNIEGIDELASLANYSVWHFIRLYSQVFGETPMRYAYRLRMSYAIRLINEGRLSVSEVSREAGFDTFSAFCRSFRDEFGTTATRFREHATTAYNLRS